MWAITTFSKVLNISLGNCQSSFQSYDFIFLLEFQTFEISLILTQFFFYNNFQNESRPPAWRVKKNRLILSYLKNGNEITRDD